VQRAIDRGMVRDAVFSARAEIIEEYPGHHYGPACLILGWLDDGRPIHIVIGLSDPLSIITVYDPSIDALRRFEAPEYRVRRADGGALQ
jgi:hypothetical protein